MKISLQNLELINKTIEAFFNANKTISIIPAKDLMPYFISAGIFPKDEKKGLPIRIVLRNLDMSHQLHLVPFVLAERKAKNTNWFFIRDVNSKAVAGLTAAKFHKTPKHGKTNNDGTLKIKDETYVIDLCDEVLSIKAERQKRFDFLLGDKGKRGNHVRLPVDAYYPILNLVIEYREEQHTKPNKHFDKPAIKTISGVHRGEQRRLYDERRRIMLPENGIQLIEITYEVFNCDKRNRIIRNIVNDKKVIKVILANFIQ